MVFVHFLFHKIEEITLRTDLVCGALLLPSSILELVRKIYFIIRLIKMGVMIVVNPFAVRTYQS